ncbi:MAG: hypothetical protein KatS3mg080_0147 [Anoxybacillus sp.]|nr:MAG: hypothetical protein KatS3mg080_0147 [Anoxybacillus sp.]
MFQSFNVSASALTAQRLRMDVISANMANVDTTRAKMVDGKWQPYRRKDGCHATERVVFFFFESSDERAINRRGESDENCRRSDPISNLCMIHLIPMRMKTDMCSYQTSIR